MEQTLREKMDEYFKTVSPEQVVKDFEELGYTFSPSPHPQQGRTAEEVLNEHGVFSELLELAEMPTIVKAMEEYASIRVGEDQKIKDGLRWQRDKKQEEIEYLENKLGEEKKEIERLKISYDSAISKIKALHDRIYSNYPKRQVEILWDAYCEQNDIPKK